MEKRGKKPPKKNFLVKKCDYIQICPKKADTVYNLQKIYRKILKNDYKNLKN